MRPFVALLLLGFSLRADIAWAQQEYAGVLLEYLTGDADAAILKGRRLDREEILAGVDAFNTTQSRLILRGAAALHTEAALRSLHDGTLYTFHLDVAAAIVEFGEAAGKLKTNSSLSIKPRHAAPVPEEFRRLWYAVVINVLEDAGKLALASKYLSRALALYPQNGEIQLLAGVAQEMQASPRTASVGNGERREALQAAEKHYRAALAAQPDRLEARLRLGRVLQLRKQLEPARALFTPLVNVPDLRVAYLASLFLAGIEDASNNTAAALALYDRAAAVIPSAQTARLAASELRHRTGERHLAAEAVAAAAGDGNTFDPWWTYVFGEYWRADLLLDALRKLRRA
jgi:tetratricopeptide (TPR) repeat protein